MIFLNLTPHSITIHLGPKTLTLSPSGDVARVEEVRAELGLLHNIPVSRATYGQPVGLPEPREGVYYIVSALVLAAVPHRADVFAPGPAVRDAEGKIVGCQGLSCTPAFGA